MKRYVLAVGACAALVAGAFSFAVLSESPKPDMSTFQTVQLADGQNVMVQKREVSIALWNRCYGAGACPFRLEPPQGEATESYPATGLSWVDSMIFIQWLSEDTGQAFRLPTLQEWRQIAQGALPAKPEPLFDAPELAWAANYLTEESIPRRLMPAGAGPVSKDGIEDLANNVWEWTDDCVPNADKTRCPAFYAAGLHDAVIPALVRDPARGGCAVGTPPPHLGLRLILEQ